MKETVIATLLVIATTYPKPDTDVKTQPLPEDTKPIVVTKPAEG
jgi:hypothetical protein